MNYLPSRGQKPPRTTPVIHALYRKQSTLNVNSVKLTEMPDQQKRAIFFPKKEPN